MLMVPASLRRYRPTRYVPSAAYTKQWPRNTFNSNSTNDLGNADIPYTAYGVPNGYSARYVDAASGNDANDGLGTGTAWQTWDKTVAAPDLTCVIFAAGTYYPTTSNTGPSQSASRRQVFQPAVGAKVWIDGGDPVAVTTAGWTNLGGGRWSIGGWGTSLANTYRWMAANGTDAAGEWISGSKRADGSGGFERYVNTAVSVFPCYPDQVRYGTTILKWAASAAAVVAGTFFYDYATGVMTVGNDPTVAGKIRATKFKRLGTFGGTSVTLRGLGFRCTATHRDDGGIIHMANACVLTMENCTLVYSQAGYALEFFGTAGQTVTKSTFAYNGNGGINGSIAGTTGHVLQYNSFVYGNLSREAGGNGVYKNWDNAAIKIVRLAGGSFLDNYVAYNTSIGLWCDISCSDITIARNEVCYQTQVAAVQSNNSMGIFYEESARGYIVDNIVHHNDGFGIIVSESNDTEVWNNTDFDNRNYDVVWSENAQTDVPAQEAIDRGVTMNGTNGRFVNNIVARPQAPLAASSVAMVHIWNQRTPVPAGTGVERILPSQDYNLYWRGNLVTMPTLVAYRDDGASVDSNAATLAAWQTAMGVSRDRNGSEADSTSVINPYFAAVDANDFRTVTGSRPTTGGLTLPPNVCNRLGIPKGSRPDIGSFHRGRSPQIVYLGTDSWKRSAVAASWGTADIGGNWTLSGTAANYTADAFVARLAITAASTTQEAYLTQWAPRDATSTVRMLTDKLAVGGNLHGSLVLRRSTVANYEYRARLRFATNGQMFVACTKLEGSATEAVVGAESAALAGLTHTVNAWYWIKADISGTTTTTINLKVWADGTTEPAAWTATITDSTPHANLQIAGYHGLLAASGSGVSNSPVTFGFDEYAAWVTPSYIFRDTFRTDVAAGSFSATRSMEPGPGAWAVKSDDENRISISGGQLRMDKRIAGNTGSPSLWTAGQTRVLGRTLLCRTHLEVADGQAMFGYDANQSLFLSGHGILISPGTGVNVNVAGTSANQTLPAGSYATATTLYEMAVILLDVGGVYLYRIAGATTWIILYVDHTYTATPLYPLLANYSATTVYPDEFREIDLAPFDLRLATSEGLAIDRKAVSAAGDTISTQADGHVHHTFVAATGVTKRIFVRRTDDNNAIIVECNQGASTCSIISKAAGVETSLNSVAQTWTNGTTYTVKITAEGATVAAYVGDALKPRATNATFNQTTTGAKVDHIGTEFKSYPRTLLLAGF